MLPCHCGTNPLYPQQGHFSKVYFIPWAQRIKIIPTITQYFPVSGEPKTKGIHKKTIPVPSKIKHRYAYFLFSFNFIVHPSKLKSATNSLQFNLHKCNASKFSATPPIHERIHPPFCIALKNLGSIIIIISFLPIFVNTIYCKIFLTML